MVKSRIIIFPAALLAMLLINNVYAMPINPCQIFAGVWQGEVRNPAALFADGGPWLFKLSLVVKKDQVAGYSDPIYDKKMGIIVPRKYFSAICDAGQLTKVFWGNRNDCGRFSKDSQFDGNQLLTVDLHWESAMTETSFTAKLKKIALKAHLKKIIFVRITPKSCH